MYKTRKNKQETTVPSVLGSKHKEGKNREEEGHFFYYLFFLITFIA